MSDKEPFTGGCACGAIRYEINAEPVFVFNCRCRHCQAATGSAYACNAWFLYPAVNYLNGTPKIHTVTGEGSGQPVHHEFCGDCGSPTGMRSEGFPEIRAVRVANMDDPNRLAPIAEIWTGRRFDWDQLRDGLPHFEGLIPDEEFAKILGG